MHSNSGFEGSGDERLGDAPLPRLRVVELEPGVAVSFAGKWLAALGAQVTKVEPVGGDATRHAGPWPTANADPEASGRALYLDTGKQSVALDLETEGDRDTLQRLLGRCDLLLTGSRVESLSSLGVDLAALRRTHPHLVSVSVTPFGESGPYAEIPSTPLTLAALSGLMWHVGSGAQAPLAQWGGQTEVLAGLHTLGAALTGAYAAIATGRGCHLELSIHGCNAAVVGHHTSRFSQVGAALPRLQQRALWRLYPTVDGWGGISALARNYARLAEVMEVPEIAQSSPFLDADQHRAEEARMTAILEKWFASRTSEEIAALALRERVPLSRVLGVAEVAESEQLAVREFFAEDDHPRAGHLRFPAQLWKSDGHRWKCERAPSLGEHTHRLASLAERAPVRATPGAARDGGLLEGVRILDLGQVWAGPYASMLLADQGADVIRVESPTAWDPNRCAAPPPGTATADWWNTCTYYHEYNGNKRSLGLDLRQPRGREIFGRLVAVSDVVVENLRADVLDRLGVGYDWLREQRDDVILVSMTGFGSQGPERELPGYGPMIEQLSGIASLTGYTDGAPHLASGYAYGDPVAAVAAASAVLTALIQRTRTGEGQHVDLAQRDVTSAMVGEAFIELSMTGRSPAPEGNERRGCAPHGVYPCLGEDEWVAIAVMTDAQWVGLREALGNPEWSRDPNLHHAAERYARRAELDAELERWCSGLSKNAVFERCRERGVPAGPVWKMPEMLEDPHLQAQGFYEWTSHPAVGRWAQHGWVWRPEGAGTCLRRPAPNFGGDNTEVLSGLLGFDAAEIAKLLSEGVIASKPVGLPELKQG